jgi:hypothetical protein
MQATRSKTWAVCGAAILSVAIAAPAWADEALPSGFSTANSSATLLAGASLAQGQTGEGPNRFSNIRFEVHVAFGWYGALGVGGRLEFPLLRQGLIQGVDDELALSIGAEVFYFYGPYLGLGVTPLLALQWNFYVSPSVSLFPELGLAFIFGPQRERYWGTFVAPYLGFGARFHFTDRNAVLLRASWPAGLQVGITF